MVICDVGDEAEEEKTVETELDVDGGEDGGEDEEDSEATRLVVVVGGMVVWEDVGGPEEVVEDGGGGGIDEEMGEDSGAEEVWLEEDESAGRTVLVVLTGLAFVDAELELDTAAAVVVADRG
ncbi:hypothetical protein AYL99_02358 [Fonsecaea erecta]|uniref:Uncharacterized protein n=1 Tax=Fonsecaea erecta TaxID=1367422 RepID=A0A178ZUL1_9EURO|nr:hypothetical protein AYL99_02358 [Fonsecaea erecta]OAP63131.1 hypothetical protein AYL99_02358 [Fonsecaea erecta]